MYIYDYILCTIICRWYFPVLFNSDDHVLDFSSNPYTFKSCVSCQVSLSHNWKMAEEITHNRGSSLICHKCSRSRYCTSFRYPVWVCIFPTTFVSASIKCISILCYGCSLNINNDFGVECDCSNCLDIIQGKLHLHISYI